MRRDKPLLITAAALLALSVALWARAGVPPSQEIPTVIRAQRLQLVDERGQVRAELFLGQDGSGNLRLRDRTGNVRVKLGTSAEARTGLLLLDDRVEPAVELYVDRKQGASLGLTGQDGKKRVLAP
jgi:hypothetical protein